MVQIVKQILDNFEKVLRAAGVDEEARCRGTKLSPGSSPTLNPQSNVIKSSNYPPKTETGTPPPLFILSHKQHLIPQIPIRIS